MAHSSREDLDNSQGVEDEQRWEIKRLVLVFTRERHTEPLTFGESDSVSTVTRTVARLDQDETFKVPGVLMLLELGEEQRLTLTSSDVLFDLEDD